MYFIFSIILIAGGITMLIRPDIFFELTQSLESDTAGEPSKRFLFCIRFGGVVCILLGVGELIVHVFLK